MIIAVLIVFALIAALAAVITAPNSAYDGISATVKFSDGKGETDDPNLIEWFQNNGYAVDHDEPILPAFPQGDAADRRLNPDAPEVLPPFSPASWNGMPYWPQMSSAGPQELEGSAPNGQTAPMTEDPVEQAKNIVAIANGEEPTTPVEGEKEADEKPKRERKAKTDPAHTEESANSENLPQGTVGEEGTRTAGMIADGNGGWVPATKGETE